MISCTNPLFVRLKAVWLQTAIHNRTGVCNINQNKKKICILSSCLHIFSGLMVVCVCRTAAEPSSAAALWGSSGTFYAAAASCWWRNCRATDRLNLAAPSKNRRNPLLWWRANYTPCWSSKQCQWEASRFIVVSTVFSTSEYTHA